MKKLLVLLFIFISMNVYAQEDVKVVDNKTSQKEQSSDLKTNEKGAKKPDFNKKKISLDRIDEKKWSLRIGYNYFMPDNKYISMFQNKLKVGGSYDFNKNFQLQAFLAYADGNQKFDIGDVSAKFKGTLYNVGALATGLYPIELSVGSIAPFGSIGAVYTFGSISTSYSDGRAENKENLSGGGVLAQAGVQYSYHILSIRAYAEYMYDFTTVKNPYISNLSGFSIGAEVGIKF